MSTTVLNFNKTEIKIRYKEPFLSEGLNSKLQAVIPSGVYRGYRLTTSVTALSVDIAGDDTYLDNIAVINTSNGYSLTVKKSAGFTVSLAANAGNTVILALTGTYTIGSDTTAKINTYSVSEYEALSDANKGALVVLGTVTVPGSGTISSNAITLDRRNSAWERMAREFYLPSSLLRNSSFEYAPDAASGKYTIPFWENEITTSNAKWDITSSFSNEGAKSLEFEVTNSASSISGSAYQWINTAVVEGQFIRIQLYIKIPVASTSVDSTGLIFIEWGDDTGAVLSTSTNTLGIATTNSGFTLVDRVFVVPANATHVKRIGIKLVNATYAGTGIKFQVDDFNAFLETINVTDLDMSESRVGQQIAAPLIISDPSALFSDVSALLRFESEELIGERSDQDDTATAIALRWKGNQILGEDLISDETEAQIARIDAEPSTASNVDYTLMWSSIPNSEKGMRWYVTPVGTYVQTQNCYWGTTTWTKDVLNETASKLEFSKNGFVLYGKIDTGDTEPWDDTIGTAGWTYKYINFDHSTLVNTMTGRIELGSDLIGTISDAILPRIRTEPALTATTDRTLIWDSGDGQDSGNRVNRIYAAPDGVFELTSNAYWDGTNWNSDDTAENSTKLLFNNSNLDMYFQSATASSWNDSSWDKQELQINADTDNNHIYGSMVLGENLLGSTANSLLPRLKLPTNVIANSRTLLLTTDSDDGSGDGTKTLFNFYAPTNSLGNFEFAVNAYHDGTNWNRTNNSNSVASKFQFSNQAFNIFRQSTAGIDWADNSWDNGGASLTISGQDNPAGTLGFTNTLLNKNIPKAWANVTVGPSSAVVFNDSFNFSTSVTVLAASVEFNFASPMANDDYVVNVTCASAGNACIANVNSQTADDFTLRFFDLNSSLTTPKDLTGANTAIFHITVFGAQ